MKFRVGTGYDVHALQEGLELWLGGIKIEHSKGCIAHSDGDVLIHAICDALLGAVSKRDIGYHFPDSDNAYQKIDSKILLSKVCDLVRNSGYEIGNIDSVVILQNPKIKSYIPQMQKVLSQVMSINEDDISVKATTTEKLGFEGKEEGISANAIALIHEK